MIAVETLLLLIGGVVLAVLLVQIFARGSEAGRGRPVIRLVRATRAADGAEETRLTINDQAILTASSAGLRLADYADEIERLEMIATRIASALGGTVELARVDRKNAEIEGGLPVRSLLSDARSADESYPR
jgi:hypothetical protein